MWTFCRSHFICPDIKTFCIEYSSPLPQKDIPNFSIRKNAITWSQCIGPAKATAHLELQSEIFLKICIKNMSLKVFFPIAFILTQSTVSYSFLERLQCKCLGTCRQSRSLCSAERACAVLHQEPCAQTSLQLLVCHISCTSAYAWVVKSFYTATMGGLLKSRHNRV